MAAGRDGSVAGEPGVAEHFQPVGVSFAGQQFRRAFADPFRPLTPQEAMVVEKELEQGQIVRSQLAAQLDLARPARRILQIEGLGVEDFA